MKQITIDDKLYPKSLKNIKNPPQVLYLEGNLGLLNSYSIAIIGSRSCSDNGKKIAQYFSSQLSMSGITIISGLAKGIDTIAHLSSYNQIGRTIAVLGSGFNNVFPSENISLYKKILENDGLVISEYPPDVCAKSNNFISRNRIISGLSLGVFVIEAKYRSGTSITANYARQQGKIIFSIPHEIWDSCGVGTNKLLKKGAIIVTSPIDILDSLKLTRFKNNYLKLKKNGAFDEKFSEHSKPNLSTEILDSKQEKIYSYINKKPILPNEISQKTDFPINEILSILFSLELEGYIKKVEGGYICI